MNYRAIMGALERHFEPATLFKWGFNLSPMFRRTTARITDVTPDLHRVHVELPISWKNRNYVGSIFGGSLFSAVDPIPMVQLLRILGDDYVVWDKEATIRFRRPAYSDVVANFIYSEAELSEIRAQVAEQGEILWQKVTDLTDRDRHTVYSTVTKTLYVATKDHYRAKQAMRRERAQP